MPHAWSRVMSDAQHEVTRLVHRWSRGDEGALDRLIELAYDDLRQIAHRHVRNSPAGHTLATTALVHELYLRLAGVTEASWGGRAQFFAFCSKAMRRILIDHARRHSTLKRGGARVRVPLTDSTAAVEAEAAELIALDEAMTLLAAHDERMARIVECRFFGGLSVPETAEALGASPRTVNREWVRARAYLSRLLSASGEADGDANGTVPEGTARA
jgi:RNA polymerase sigma factor (TIGR02999 family)